MKFKCPNGAEIDVPKCCSICLDKQNPDGTHFVWMFHEGYDPVERYRFQNEIKKNFEGVKYEQHLSFEKDCGGIIKRGDGKYG